MNTMTLTPAKDPIGTAIMTFLQEGKASPITLHSTLFDDDVLSAPYLFRSYDYMSKLEQTALELARGHVLDVGAGAGSHALILQNHLPVKAIDVSPLCVETMKLRGVKDAECINLFDFRLEGNYDTILMLMNGTGLIGSLINMSLFFARMRVLLAHGGQVLIDSCDLRYKYGMEKVDPGDRYYGQVEYRIQYNDVYSDAFDWLYIDYKTLHMLARANGFDCELICEGNCYDYLAKLSLS